MKLHVHFESGGMKVDEVVSGTSADEVVAAMQRRVAQEAGFLIGAVVKRMTPLQFAQEATRRYNTSMKDNVPLPQTCEEFVTTGIQKGFATLVES